MILTLVLLLLTAVALGAVLAPLLKSSAGGPARGRYDRAIYRDQLKEIERDVARGLVKPEDAAAARREIERRILVAEDEPDAPPPSAPKRRLAVILSGVSVVGAFLFYLLLGTPDLPDLPFAHRAPAEHQGAAIRDMVEGLAARLQKQPDDVDGWLMLGRSYTVLGDNAKAADAYEHAHALKPDDPAIALNEAGALLADSKPDDPIPEHVVELLKSVEASQPDQPMVLWFLGKVAAQQLDFPLARQYWQHLLDVIPANAPERQTVSDALASLEGK